MMNLLADPQILAAVLAVILTAIAGVAGYLLREWISKSAPFMAVTAVNGETRRRGRRVDIPEKVIKSLERSILQTRLPEKATLRDISDVLEHAVVLRDRGSEFSELVQHFREAVAKADEAAAQTALAEVLLDEDFDHWMTLVIGERSIPVPPFDPALPAVIDCGEEPNARGGSFAIGFPGRSLRFGSGLNEFTLYRSGVAAFVELVRRMELQKLLKVLEGARDCVLADVGVAKEIAPPLQDIVDRHSQWAVRVYMANLGSVPFLVQVEATLEIEDRNGGRYSEACALLLFESDDEGKRRSVRTTSPLVVRSETDVEFAFVTKLTQSEMTAGDPVRALFRAGSANCFLKLAIDRPGLKRRQHVTTPVVPFSQSTRQAA